MDLRPVMIQRVGVVGPFGVGLDAFLDWWRQGRPDLAGEPTSLKEPWLPTELACEVPAWRARAWLPDRKSIKLMTRCVQFGVAAALEAWGPRCVEETVPPERRGMYTGCGVPADEDWTFREAVNASVVHDRFDLPTFGGPGQDLLNPLWLVKSLTNNVLAFTAKTLDLQGANDNFEAGAAGPLLALGSAAQAVAESRLEQALAGGSDSLVTVEALLGLGRHGAFDGERPLLPSQGGAFARLEPGGSGDFGLLGFCSRLAPLPPGAAPSCGPWPAVDVEEALAGASRCAWKQAGGERGDGLLLRGPRLPGGAGDLDLWSALGDPGVAAGALLVAAAWALRHADGQVGPIELAAAGPGGEVVVAILGTLE
jgi:hypothetical protein